MKLVGRRFALALWYTNDDGSDAVAVHAGTLVRSRGAFTLHRLNAPSIELLPQWIPRIRKVRMRMRPMFLGASRALSLRVGDLPEDADMAEYERFPVPRLDQLEDRSRS